MAFDYNEDTNLLVIIGRDPRSDLLLSVGELIDEKALFRNELFYNYVLGMALKSIARPLSVFEFKLIGGTQVNFSDIMAEGQEMINEVKETIKDEQSGDAAFFIVGDQTI